VVFRDELTHEDIYWDFADTETTWVYAKARGVLESLGYAILSVTGDGFSGIRSGFLGIPFQMCHVHMERLVIRGTTRNPKTEAGTVLLALAKSLHDTDRLTCQRRLAAYFRKYNSFLHEKTFHPEGGWSFTHEELRRASLSFRKLFSYLFTYEKNAEIPTTTNSLEGHFAHVKDLMKIHRGASKEHQQKILNSIMLNSSIALLKQKKA